VCIELSVNQLPLAYEARHPVMAAGTGGLPVSKRVYSEGMAGHAVKMWRGVKRNQE
jgi:hypothetical protein